MVAWNRAATVVLTDYGALPPEQRNILRLIFLDPRVRAAQYDWESVARFVVAAFRADAARAGATRRSRRWWRSSAGSARNSRRCGATTMSAAYGEGIKQLRHPDARAIALEYSAFAVDGRPDLGMVVYNPATPADAEKIRSLLKSKKPASRKVA